MQVISRSLTESRSDAFILSLSGLLISLMSPAWDVINEICTLVCYSLTEARAGIIVFIARALRISAGNSLDQAVTLFFHELAQTSPYGFVRKDLARGVAQYLPKEATTLILQILP